MLQKTPVDISFAQGLDLQSDPKRVAIGKFLTLVNSVFTTTGLLQKRNGFPALTSLPTLDTTILTTFNDDLTAIGSDIFAYSTSLKDWVDKATLFPCELSTLPLIRSNLNQSQADSVVSANGLVCTVYTDQNPASLTDKLYRYVVADAVTGQNIIEPTTITSADPTYGTPRVFLLGTYFVILFTTHPATYHLRYIAVSANDPTIVTSPRDISSNYAAFGTLAFDGLVVGNQLFVAYYSLTGGDSVKVTYISDVAVGPVTAVVLRAVDGEIFSLCADTSNPQSPVIYISFVSFDVGIVFAAAVDTSLNIIMPALGFIGNIFANIATTATDGVLTVFCENYNNYPGNLVPTHYISTATLQPSFIFTSVFASGAASIVVSSTRGLVVGMYLLDITTIAHITTGTTITSIVGTTVGLSVNTAGNSAASPGDRLIGVFFTGTPVIRRSVGLASKAFLLNNVSYMLVAYTSAFQPSFFMMDGSGNIIYKLAYSNAGNLPTAPELPYLPTGLPNYSFTASPSGTLTAGSTLVTSVSNINGIVPGMPIYGHGLSLGTYVVSAAANLITMSASASLSVIGAPLSIGTLYIAYLVKDSITAVNKANAATNIVAGIYAQAGINLGQFTIGTTRVCSSEAANTLNLSGGFVWSYDGYTACEQNFFVWPDYVKATWTSNSVVTPTGTWALGSTSVTLSSSSGVSVGMTIVDTTGGHGAYIPAGTVITAVSGVVVTISHATTTAATGDALSIQGNIAALSLGVNTNAYYYQVLYSWADNQGNRNMSAPSIPLGVTSSGSATTGIVTLVISTLRLTYKINNPVKIEVYRWSVLNPVYYQVTSTLLPLLNNPVVDTVTFVDTLADASIVGNEIIYTTGGVVEDISPPATSIMTLFQTRMWLVDAEDRNLLWFSKQIIDATPIEFSDVFTYYVSPTIGASGSTGPITALFPMDDKLIVWKHSACYYINGSGPDNRGANSQFSEPIFISSTIGCANQQSLVLIPQGIMFESDKGIWLLGRDLSTQYIGGPVQSITQDNRVTSAVTVPDTTQVRFTMKSGITLMFDYYFSQWGTFTINALSSTLYQGQHTYLNIFGQVFQESPGTYLDGSAPVLMSFTTSWISLAGIQGFERFYYALMLGSYITPFLLDVQFAYDFNDSPSQSQRVAPDGYEPDWGGDALWGSNRSWGGTSGVFKSRVFPDRQKCETFQLTVNELYDPSYGVPSGAGLSLSGLSLIVGVKRGFRTQSAGGSS